MEGKFLIENSLEKVSKVVVVLKDEKRKIVVPKWKTFKQLLMEILPEGAKAENYVIVNDEGFEYVGSDRVFDTIGTVQTSLFVNPK